MTVVRPRTFSHEAAEQMYLDGLSPSKIGLLLGVSHRTVENALGNRGLTLAHKGRATYEKWAEILTAPKPVTPASAGSRPAGYFSDSD